MRHECTNTFWSFGLLFLTFTVLFFTIIQDDSLTRTGKMVICVSVVFGTFSIFVLIRRRCKLSQIDENIPLLAVVSGDNRDEENRFTTPNGELYEGFFRKRALVKYLSQSEVIKVMFYVLQFLNRYI